MPQDVQPSRRVRYVCWRLALLVCVLLLAALPAEAQDAAHRVSLPLVLKSSTAPKASMSYYITTAANEEGYVR